MRFSKIVPPAACDRPMIRVWDRFVRVFHWSLVGLFVFCFASGDIWDDAHEWAGYAIAILICSRIVWGLVGPTHARFSDFIYWPSTVLKFLRESVNFRAKRYLGHNPAGGAMVIALLVALTTTCTTGVMMGMDAFWGASWVENLHVWSTYSAIALIVLHVIGVILASIEHRENLVGSMFTGRKRSN
jgi:cytochrome b